MSGFRKLIPSAVVNGEIIFVQIRAIVEETRPENFVHGRLQAAQHCGIATLQVNGKERIFDSYKFNILESITLK